ncbi:taste receptor type 2 member 40-like [Pelobates fuscus]|uniref:taste receptor type 2 member 40-like n=1 Tax=Pelobates fuscus TaxID=191477 RepID=UPI002FE499AC
MVPSYIIVALSALGISTFIGFATNLFIIVAHGMDRVKGRNINPRELILFTLGLFNITFQCTMAANDTVLFLWSDLYFSDNVYAVFSVLLLFTIFSSFWFTFCLCGFYYVMLVTFEQTFFMRLKQRISHVVPCTLSSSILLSLTISVPVAWNITRSDYSGSVEGNLISNSTTELSTPGLIDGNFPNNSTLEFNTPYELLHGNLTNNTTIEYSIPQMSLQYLLVTSIIGCCIPLVLVAVANILIIKSLCVHANRLGKNSGGMSVQSVDASVSAARTVTSLLILYISFYISQILLIMGIFDAYSLWFSVCLLVTYAYSPIQSIILIFGSPKLKSTLVKIVSFPNCTKVKSPSETIKAITSQTLSQTNII